MNSQSLNEIEGLQFIPVDSNKRPIPKNWQNAIMKYDLSNVEGIGLVCGTPSGNLECIDLDCKYDLTGKLFDSYKRLIHSVDDKLLNKLVVQKTRGKGYHFIYRCPLIAGNMKLANRPTTEDERNETYTKSYEAALVDPKKPATDEEAKTLAEKARKNDKVRVLIETRGIGGQFVCAPSTGYQFIFGDLCSISEITPDERDTLHGIARQFNQVFEEERLPKTFVADRKQKGVSPFEDYDDRGDVVQLLESNGWKFVKDKGKKTLLLRPGQTTAESSGNYDYDRKWFSVFTTSTEFEPQKAYRPYAVFAILECNKDFSAASKKLYEMGYGDRWEDKPKEKAPSTRVIQSRIVADDDDYSFLANGNDYNPYLGQVIDGTLQMGLTTGSPKLDQHFLFKRGNLVMDNGHDNTGKSVWVWWLLLLAALHHGWKFGIFSSENTIGAFMRKMIQFYWGKPLRGPYAMTPAEYNEAKTFIEKHFFPIKAQEDLFNYKDIINMMKKLRSKYGIDAGMIDPYNSLKTDLSGFSKLSTHDYHYEALSEIKSFGQVNSFGWFVNHHAVTESLRKLDKDGYVCAPQKADTEGGGKVSNKADDFITIHRKTQHPTDWGITEIHVRKIKDTETGGMPTHLNAPVLFEMYKGQCGFREKTEMGYEIDPICEYHKKNGVFIPQYSTLSVSNYRSPFKDEEEIPDILF